MLRPMKTNRLAQEKSPYLLQHAHNPVQWFAWGPEALQKAREEKKLIFLSIGYSTCYWCHVMEKECFEKEEVGAALENFVCIKVDREEHPEVDEIYMDAVIAMTGRGGWPMSVFLTPEAKPFWGGTYIPFQQFLSLIKQVEHIWVSDPQRIENGGEKLLAALQEEDAVSPAGEISDQEICEKFLQQAEARFDPQDGGFGPAPKFPPSMALRFLLRVSHAGEKRALPMVEKTLEAMACGGLFDQVGGGFHRYSTDEKWLVPHFEKMLYDNALLATTYLEAHQLTGDSFYSEVAKETLDYLLRDMRAPGGAFYAAEDAGEVHREGEFYVWDETLPAEEKIFFAWAKGGNFEGDKQILVHQNKAKWLEFRLAGRGVRDKLQKVRSQRKRPHRDEKILTSWNGLALQAFALASGVLGRPDYLLAAETCALWMRLHLWKEGRLLRRFAGGEAKYFGTASDYAYLIDGLLALYEASFKEEYLLWARELQKVLDEEFWDETGAGYFTASVKEENLLVRKKDGSDGAIPSPNSVQLRNLLRLAQIFQETELRERAEKLRSFLLPKLARVPYGVADAGIGIFYRLRGERLLVTDALRERGFAPDVFVVCGGGDKIPSARGKEGEFTLCERGVCYPGTSWDEGWKGQR